jgi:aryl-alcohol dehydrogenase (NADP+)
VLTGKYRPDAAPEKDTRAGRNDKRMMQTEWRPESLKLAQEIKQHAEAKGITAGQFAVSWVLNSSFVSAVIAGPRTEEQWDDYIRALDYRFTADDEALIDRLTLTEARIAEMAKGVREIADLEEAPALERRNEKPGSGDPHPSHP